MPPPNPEGHKFARAPCRLFFRCYQIATTRCCEQHSRHRLACLLQLLRHCVRVLIKRDGRAVMPRQSLRNFRGNARLDQGGHEEVPQHMERALDWDL
jgi:hypothetical protein